MRQAKKGRNCLRRLDQETAESQFMKEAIDPGRRAGSTWLYRCIHDYFDLPALSRGLVELDVWALSTAPGEMNESARIEPQAHINPATGIL